MKYRKLGIAFILILLTTFSRGFGFGTTEKVLYILLPGSYVGFNGSSIISTFTCGTDSVIGLGSGTITSGSLALVDFAKVMLKVETLDCGSPFMNTDMYDALKADDNYLIDFELSEVNKIEKSNKNDGTYDVTVLGKLSVAGITKNYEMVFNIKTLEENLYKITGSKKLSMFDFEITPPTAFFGLIKANDTLEIYFDLLVKVDFGQNTIAVENR